MAGRRRLKAIKVQPQGDGGFDRVAALPIHPRVAEWNGFTKGQRVEVAGPHDRSCKRSVWTFQAYVTPPDHDAYIEVLEQKAATRTIPGPKIMRAFAPERVTAIEARRPKRQAKLSGTPIDPAMYNASGT